MSGSISSIVFGLAVVVVGLALLANNLGITSINIGFWIGRYWPILLVAMGLSSLVRRRGDDDRDDDAAAEDDGDRHIKVSVSGRGSGSNVGGWLLLIVGLMLLSGTAGWYRFNWGRFWGVAWALFDHGGRLGHTQGPSLRRW